MVRGEADAQETGGARRAGKVRVGLRLALALLVVGAATTLPAQASSKTSALKPTALERAQGIRLEATARYLQSPGAPLAVTEASSTGVFDSFTLLTPDLVESRIVAADNGIYYAICPVRANCPYPARRFARPAADLVPRRLALELALRTFLETSVDVVAVSLPTPRFNLVVFERAELAREVEIATLAKALSGDPARALSASLESVVDRVTRPRVFLFVGLERTASGRDSWAGLPRWPGSAV
jgi:hypothetical protein